MKKKPLDFIKNDDHIRFGQGLVAAFILSAVIIYCSWALYEALMEAIKVMP